MARVRLMQNRLRSVVVVLAVGLAAGMMLAPNAIAAVAPIANPLVGQVTADVLPTVQIDGVVWTQTMIGNTVFAGGQFTKARPAGAAAGVNTTTRNNLLSFDVTTGALKPLFAPSLNSSVKALAASPDGTRLYVGGNFTSVNGATHSRIVALDPATGATIAGFSPVLDYTVNSIVATNTTVYVGGAFNSASGKTRNRIAAFQASNGALLPGWVANADGTVFALTMAPSGKIVAGGAFKTINGTSNIGMAALNATTGAVEPWAATNVVRNFGPNSAILSLRSDATKVYGTGYKFGSGGNFEGAFAADGTSGSIYWLEDCHGDTYDNLPMGGVLYTVSHAHFCGNVGGFPDSTPRDVNQRRALAFTLAKTGTVNTNTTGGYSNFGGQPSPSLTNWFPALDPGTFTGKTQAAWSIAGNTQYVVLGGEFPKVNGVAQQGLARFAVKQLAPKKMGPRDSGSKFVPTLQRVPTGVKLTWPANIDYDDLTLTYGIVRDGASIKTMSADATFWNRPTMTFTDSTVALGNHTYRIEARDSSQNTAIGSNVSIAVQAAAAPAAQLGILNELVAPAGTAPDGANARAKSSTQSLPDPTQATPNTATAAPSATGDVPRSVGAAPQSAGATSETSVGNTGDAEPSLPATQSIPAGEASLPVAEQGATG